MCEKRNQFSFAAACGVEEAMREAIQFCYMRVFVFLFSPLELPLAESKGPQSLQSLICHCVRVCNRNSTTV